MNHGEKLAEVAGPGRLEGFEWGDVRPYVMFFTGRCGSTWLTELLAATGSVGSPREWLNFNVATYSNALAGSLPAYFANVVERHSAGGRFGIQVDPVRLRDTLPLVDWDAMFPASRTKTFFLYRRDLVAQAWSWAYALKSGRWHSTDAGLTPGPEAVPTIADLTREMVRLRRQEENLFAFWVERGYEPHFIEYEALATDPPSTVAAILRDLGAPAEGARVVERETRAQRLRYDGTRVDRVSEFASLNRVALDALARDRFGVGSQCLAEALGA